MTTVVSQWLYESPPLLILLPSSSCPNKVQQLRQPLQLQQLQQQEQHQKTETATATAAAAAVAATDGAATPLFVSLTNDCNLFVLLHCRHLAMHF